MTEVVWVSAVGGRTAGFFIVIQRVTVGTQCPKSPPHEGCPLLLASSPTLSADKTHLQQRIPWQWPCAQLASG